MEGLPTASTLFESMQLFTQATRRGEPSHGLQAPTLSFRLPPTHRPSDPRRSLALCQVPKKLDLGLTSDLYCLIQDTGNIGPSKLREACASNAREIAIYCQYVDTTTTFREGTADLTRLPSLNRVDVKLVWSYGNSMVSEDFDEIWARWAQSMPG